MSMEDLDAYVWSQLGTKKYAAGRGLVGRLTRRVIRKFPHSVMGQVRPDSYGVVIDEISRSIERSERQNYRMGIILSLVLGALIQEIVKAIFKWWQASASNRALLLGWQMETRLR